jgi:hypothetical protein
VSAKNTGGRNTRVPQLLVEQLVLGELSPEKAATVRARLEAEPQGLERLAEIEASNAQVLKRMPARVLAARVAQEPAPASRRWMWAPALAIAAAVLLYVGVPPQDPVQPVIPVDPGVRIKGPALELAIHLQTAEGPVLLEDQAQVQAGDQLQLSTMSAKPAYGAVFSVDGNGVLTQHLPERGTTAVLLEPGQHPLPHAYTLDDAPDFERFFLLSSSEPFALQPLMQKAWSGAVELDPKIEQRVLTLRKETP